MLDKGVPWQVVAEMLGTSERMLRLYYAHLMDRVIDAGAEVWAEALGRDV
jgi:hypothetical protein